MAFKRSAVRLRSAPPGSKQGFGNEALFSFDRVLCAVAFLLALAAAYPAAAQEQITFERTDLAIVTAAGARHQFKVEWAKTWPQKARGLMYRKDMAIDHGMLLDYDPPQAASIWMKNTLIPLDMIFIDDTGRIVGIVERAEPKTLTARGVNEPSRYVLEVNGGWSAAHGVAKGDTVRFENVMF